MQNIELYFDGNCPESQLRGQQVEMKLNHDDFWESEATGLQIAVFPPYAAILRWRGDRRFRESSEVASNQLTGLILTEAHSEAGTEFFPDENKIIKNSSDLDSYLGQIFENKEKYVASKSGATDTKLDEQRQYLKTISKSEFQGLSEMFQTLQTEENVESIMQKPSFEKLHKKVYDMKLIFDFKWQDWPSGWEDLNDVDHDFSKKSALELSMYLTAIFRADRFSDGTIDHYYGNQTLSKIIAELCNK